MNQASDHFNNSPSMRKIFSSPYLIPSLAVCCFILAGSVSKAQPGNTYNEEITVTAPFKPQIADATKIYLYPKTGDTVELRPEFSYRIFSVPFISDLRTEPIKAARLQGEPIPRVYHNLLKAGYGTKKTPLIEYHYQNLRSRNKTFGVNLSHLSSGGDIDEYGHSAFSENDINVFASTIKRRKYMLGGDISFNRDVVHFYGFRTADYPAEPDNDDIRQRYNLFGLNAFINSIHDDSSHLNYMFRTDYSFLTDINNTGEHIISLKGDLNKHGSFLEVSKQQTIGLSLHTLIFNNQSDSLESNTTGIISLHPYLNTRLGRLSLSAGFNATIQADTTSYFRLYPAIHAKVDIIKRFLAFEFNFTGNLERNSFHYFYDENPFISSNIPVSFRNNTHKISGGLVGSLGKNTDYSVFISRSHYDNMPFYITDTISPYRSRFTVLNDDVDLLEIEANLGFNISEKFRFVSRFYFHEFYTSDLPPWQEPDIELSFSGRYNIADKFILKGDLFILSKMYALNYNDFDQDGILDIEPKYIEGTVDGNFSFEYRYSSILSVFLNFNNIGGRRYYMWYEYPSYRFTFLGGLTYKF